MLGVLGDVPARAAAGPTTLTVAADRDDDDLDGQPDGEEAELAPAARADVVALDHSFVGAKLRPITGAEHARLVAGGHALPWGSPLPAGAGVQGLSPGVVNVVVTRGGAQESLLLTVAGAQFRDGEGKVIDPAHSHASLDRTPPTRIEGGTDSRYDDPDALRFVLEVPEDDASPGIVSVESVGPSGARLDGIPRLGLDPVACKPAQPGVRCVASAPLRFTVDDVDRRHPLVEARSIRALVGGGVVVRLDGRKLAALRVLGPRSSSVGPIGALKATLRPVVMRVSPGGAPAIGGNDAGAASAFRAELSLAAAIWGQCGLTFGNVDALEVHILDPPVAHLVAIGDDLAIPAGGGELRLRAAGHPIVVPIAKGAAPESVADSLSRALARAGLVGVVSANARTTSGVAGSVDVSVRRPDGRLVAVEPYGAGAPLSSDPLLSVRIGSVDLSDGLQHFSDMDSTSGTLEERTLLKALDSRDPGAIDIVVVPFFAGGGRIGESFIGSDLSSVRNVVLLDRAGIRARKSSLTLAHELGHVLLDMPGHPDDYGIDTPSLLMDSDASDSSPFGPRRLTVEECARVVRESGPLARAPLLTPWSLEPLAWAATAR